MDKCELCNREEEDLTLLSVNHKELGHIMICQDCWTKLYSENRMVWEGTSSGSSCPTCR